MSKEKYCGECKWYFACQKEFWVSEYTEQQSVIGCHLGEESVPKVNEDGEEELDENS